MPVPMVQVGKVGVPMANRGMSVGVRMRFRTFVTAMWVLVVRVMNVAMIVVHRVVLVLMPVPLGKHEPSARGGQGEGGAEHRSKRLAEKRDGKHRTEERRGTEVGGRARCAEMTQ